MHDLGAVTPVLAKIVADHDAGAVASLLAKVEKRDESIARSMYEHLAANSEAIAEAVRAEPAAESLRATAPEQPAEPEADLPPSAVDPLIGRGRRWAVQLRRKELEQTQRELLAAAAKWQPDTGEEADAERLTRGYLPPRGKYPSFDTVTANSALEAIAAAGPDGPDLSVALLVNLGRTGYMHAAALCLEMLIDPPDGYSWAKLGKHVPAAVPSFILPRLLLELVSPSAYSPSRTAVSTRCSGCDAPSRNEKLECTCNSAYGTTS
jgi:hypothetical protein